MSSSQELQKAAGKLILGRIPGLELDEGNKSLLEQGIIGGAVLFKENGRDAVQLSQLCDDIRKSSFHSPQGFQHLLKPFFIAINNR